MYERGLLEKYKAWKAKKLEIVTNITILNFFESNPTDEQLMLVSKILREYEQKDLIIMAILLFGGVIAGLFFGIGLVL